MEGITAGRKIDRGGGCAAVRSNVLARGVLCDGGLLLKDTLLMLMRPKVMRPAATAGQARSLECGQRERCLKTRGERSFGVAQSVKLECENEVGDRRAGSLAGGERCLRCLSLEGGT